MTEPEVRNPRHGASRQHAADGAGRAGLVTFHARADGRRADVTACRYAQFYNKIGAPELGFLLTCSADFAHAEGFGAGVQLTRTQTIMQGASHCDFRYLLKQREKGTR
jgi:hypothetical protein